MGLAAVAGAQGQGAPEEGSSQEEDVHQEASERPPGSVRGTDCWRGKWKWGAQLRGRAVSGWIPVIPRGVVSEPRTQMACKDRDRSSGVVREDRRPPGWDRAEAGRGPGGSVCSSTTAFGAL